MISKRAHKETIELTGSAFSKEPNNFKLLNSNRVDITDVSFDKKDSIERSIEENISKLSGAGPELTKNRFKGMDTLGIYLSPIQIIKTDFTQKEYSRLKDVQLTYKNISAKPIQGIRFRWYGQNAFHEPAEMSLMSGWGGGFSDRTIKPGETKTLEWDVSSGDGKKILLAFAYEVAFEDGTKWELGK